MKFKIDKNSLKFKIWLYFVIFAAILMAILWLLQTLFLNSYYQEMKISETRKIAESIIEIYDSEDEDEKENLIEYISALSYKNDMYIHIETSKGDIIFKPESNRPNLPSNAYFMELSTLKQNLYDSNSNTVSIIMKDIRHKNNTLAYGAFLKKDNDEEVVLYIFSPLFPVESTVEILSNQLKYVTLISLLLSFALSFLISRRLTKPISRITNSASELALGNYEVTFDGGHYSELVKLADTLNYTSKELAKAENLRKDLIANVSHDLKTPLTMVKSYAEMIKDISGDNPDKRNSHLKVIIDEADRLNLLVNDLLSLSKMQSGVEVLENKLFNMTEAVSSVIQTYKILEETEGYEISFKDGESLYARGDETRIKQVISNLVSNAIKYSSENRKIEIILSTKSDKIKFEVKDSGQGIPKDELENIWERYYKSSANLERDQKGTGLGLSIVKQIFLLHGANFGVESELGKGSTFWFELKNK